MCIPWALNPLGKVCTASRGPWLFREAKHQAMPGALLHSAAPFLSGLTIADVAFIQKRIERHVAPDVAKARAAALKAMKEAEQSWQRTIDKIGERAGLTKGDDGT